MVLEREAGAQRISVNALITGILKRYTEFDRLSEKFDFVSMPGETFRSIFLEVPDDRIKELAKGLGATMPAEIIRFWFTEVNVETFLSYMSMFSRYYRLVKYDIKVDSRDYTILLHHSLGAKWSKFLRHFLDEAITTMLGTVPKFEVGKSLVTVRFTVRDPTIGIRRSDGFKPRDQQDF